MTTSISDTLGEIFGTKEKTAAAVAPVAHTPEDLEKRAQLDYFSSLCATNGIDVGKLDDGTVQKLWDGAMAKMAEESPEEKAKREKEEKAKEKEASVAASKIASAEAEYIEKRAAAVKVAEAEAMGRIMAHSFVAECKSIAEAEKTAGEMPPAFAANAEKKGKEGKPEEKDEKEEEEKKKEASARAAALLLNLPTKTASDTSTTPNFDAFAANRAIELLKEAGQDEELAFSRVNAVFILGLNESTKIAAAADIQTAVHVRALEFCEAAGFQVTWA